MEAKNASDPISQDEYDSWRASKVTQRLFQDLEERVVVEALEATFSTDPAVAGVQASSFEAFRDTALEVTEWAPLGVKGPLDKELKIED